MGSTGRVAGIDPGTQQIIRARAKAARRNISVEFQVGVIEQLPFPDQTFDVVFSTLMMHHLPAPLKRQGLAEMARVLKPGGRLVTADFKHKQERAGLSARFHVGGSRIQELEDLLKEAGFDRVGTEELRPDPVRDWLRDAGLPPHRSAPGVQPDRAGGQRPDGWSLWVGAAGELHSVRAPDYRVCGRVEPRGACGGILEVGPALVGWNGIELMIASFFPKSENAAGHIYDPLGVHMMNGMIFFLNIGIVLVVLSLRFARDERWSDLALYTRVLGIALFVMSVLNGYFAAAVGDPLHPWLGLFQRMILAVWFLCLLILALRLWRVGRSDVDTHLVAPSAALSSSMRSDQAVTTGIPRWMIVFGIITLLLLLTVVLIEITTNGMGGMQMSIPMYLSTIAYRGKRYDHEAQPTQGRAHRACHVLGWLVWCGRCLPDTLPGRDD
nr:methyltransferase domain-containing protein [Ktedonobacter sp. SOSP1-52]